VNLYPTEVERVLLKTNDVGSNYQLVLERPGALDELTVVCELAVSDLDASAVRARVARALQQEIGLSVNVDVRSPGSLPRSEGKAVRVIDRR
jgi:phenylacetate-CoA ligase